MYTAPEMLSSARPLGLFKAAATASTVAAPGFGLVLPEPAIVVTLLEARARNLTLVESLT